MLAEAGRSYSPALLANYAYDLAETYNRFYYDHPVLKEENSAVRALRLLISAIVARTLRNTVALLGIEMPERM